ncbi:hypothetical protein AKJ37_05115 [candidate division MSBL1 archaeon SCGC-AAA259I09]|uniref:Glycosyltransferase subfamily 4-like N-terminal domain-containing protein n=1 Tax=candidate division MSBL1 archaeon SCGC-AAA259I09 TaxID=1698267 RepID=A0A133UQR7_9EURY|nr:hypothetical protein AKJ37_05115 [candidate division MSBL1 archaeon SCGC-AAA259I09]
MKRLLYFTKISPFPPIQGERIRALNILRILDNFCRVDGFVTNKDSINFSKYYSEYGFKNTRFYKLEDSKPFYKEIPSCFKKDKNYINKMLAKIQKHNYDLAMIDYGWLGHYINFFKKNDIDVVYDTHNFQSLLVKQAIGNGILSSFYALLNYPFKYLHERLYFNKSDFLLSVSKRDISKYENFIDEKKLVLLPNFVFLEDYGVSKPLDDRDFYICMIGNFNIFQNRQGFLWFYNNVWSKVKKDLDFLLVGKGSKRFLNEFEYMKKDNIKATGKVESVLDYVKNSIAVIVPLLHGSGTRFKILEAFAMNTPVISTSKGAEGLETTHSKNILISDHAENFAKNIQMLAEKESYRYKLSRNARALLQKKYCAKANAPILKKLVKGKL